MRVFARIVVLLAAFAAAPGAVAAEPGELVMFETADCPWCRAWHRDVGPVYPRTSEAQRFPLRRVDMARPWPADLVGVAGVRFSPTFVVRLRGHEVGRIVGYSGEDHFWGWLEAIVAEATRAESRKESQP